MPRTSTLPSPTSGTHMVACRLCTVDPSPNMFIPRCPIPNLPSSAVSHLILLVVEVTVGAGGVAPPLTCGHRPRGTKGDQIRNRVTMTGP
jgi:hypothetical protein